jgi:hypothetical protein
MSATTTTELAVNALGLPAAALEDSVGIITPIDPRWR